MKEPIIINFFFAWLKVEISESIRCGEMSEFFATVEIIRISEDILLS